MADQADWPDIYIDASAAGGGDGSFDTPYNSFAQINWTSGGDNSIYDYYAGTPTQSVTINLKRGEMWKTQLTIGASGTATYRLKTQSYGTGADPIIRGSIDLTTATYKWTESTTQPGSYFCTLTNGTNPSLAEPNHWHMFLDGVRMTNGTIGSLSDHEWAFGNIDSLGFDTVYVADASGDPDDIGSVIEQAVVDRVIYGVDKHYVTVDGIEMQQTTGAAVTAFNASTFWTVQNSTIDYCGGGVRVGPACNDWVVDGCLIDHTAGAGFAIGGAYGYDPIERFLFQDTIVRNTVMGSTDSAGMKAFMMNNSTIRGCTFNNNRDGGIRLDGGVSPERWGCDYNVIEQCLVYGNGNSGSGVPNIQLEFSAHNIIRFCYCYDAVDGENNIGLSHEGSDYNVLYGNIMVGTTQAWNGATGCAAATIGNEFYNNIAYNCAVGYYIQGSDVIFKNNIAHTCSQFGLLVANGITNFESDYNCYYNCSTNPVAEYGNPWSGENLATWFARTGNDEHSFTSNPLLTDPANGDFTLQEGSPCIGTADNTLGSPYNIGLLPGSTWPDGVLTGDRDDY